ncbi:hypothetical protein [Portibacter marinus]|nr:hypothetical protein [Portibacter marinus]
MRSNHAGGVIGYEPPANLADGQVSPVHSNHAGDILVIILSLQP